MIKGKNKFEPDGDDFDFSEIMFGHHDDDAISVVVRSLIEASNQQTAMAIELTRLVVDKTPQQERNSEEIFSVFRMASKEISEAENFPLKKLWEKFSMAD